MKSTIRKRKFQAIYRLLDRVSPVPFDCGTLCGAACCSCEDIDYEDQMGIYLLPGEEKVFSRKEDWLSWSVERAEDYRFPASWSGKIYFLGCETAPTCPRTKRPLQCRIFPLTPHITEDGQLRLIWSTTQLPYRCPLIDDKTRLSTSFIQANYTVWKHLLRDPLIYDLVKMDSSDRIREGATISFPNV